MGESEAFRKAYREKHGHDPFDGVPAHDGVDRIGKLPSGRNRRRRAGYLGSTPGYRDPTEERPSDDLGLFRESVDSDPPASDNDHGTADAPAASANTTDKGEQMQGEDTKTADDSSPDQRALEPSPRPPMEVTTPIEAGPGLVVNPEAFRHRLNAMLTIRKIILEQLKVDIHFGTVPGISRPFLFQPGAQLILHCYQLSPRYLDERIEWFDHFDKETGETSKQVRCRVRCTLVRWISGEPVYEGMTRECSSLEKKFYERQFDRVVWSKKWQKEYPFKAEPVASFAGDVIRQSQKRAMVDSARLFSGLDDKFTQDAELVGGEGDKKPSTPSGNGASKSGKVATPQPVTGGGDRATPEQRQRLGVLCGQLKANVVAEVEKRKEKGWKLPLTQAQTGELITDLEARANNAGGAA